ncbi:MAG: hypothetical protein KBT20_03165 [Bacteroidales bacterium]|nr:hypothetical protein [Candidatus Liminaster caballi]
MAHSKYINVPTKLLQTMPQDSLQRSLLSLSVAIKSLSPSSVYLCRSCKQMRKDFNMGKQRADKLMHAIHHSSLFRVEQSKDGTLRITARCYRHDYAHTIQCGKHKASLAMNVAKIRCMEKDNIRLDDIEQELKEMLHLMFINSQNRKDELKTKHSKKQSETTPHANRSLSVNALSALSGYSGRTVIRRNNYLEAHGAISIDRCPPLFVCRYSGHLDAAEGSGFFRIKSNLFYRMVNAYQIEHFDMRKRFQHIIYSHTKRLTRNVVANDARLSMSELFELYD